MFPRPLKAPPKKNKFGFPGGVFSSARIFQPRLLKTALRLDGNSPAAQRIDRGFSPYLKGIPMKKLTAIFLCLLIALLPALALGEQTAAPSISFEDDEGRQISLSAPAERIIVLYGAHAENLYALGAQERIIGAHSTAVYPPAAAFLPRYDYSADPEYIIAANPDVVLIRPWITRKVPDFVSAIEKAGITVVSLFPDTLDDFDQYIMKLALLTGTTEKAETLLADFHAELGEISALTAEFEPKTRVYFESTETELRTVTPTSMAGMALSLAGGVNVAADAEAITEGSSIAAFGAERILAIADEIDVYVSQRGAMNAGGNEHSISIRPGFSTIKAVREGRIFVINEKLVSSPTFRYLKGVRELARHFYPEQMDDLTAYKTDTAATRRDFANIVYRARHLSMFVPSSSSYYETEHKEHTYGLFSDVTWQDADFDAIESCVQAGFIGYDGDFYNPEGAVTREDLAKTVFLIGNFEAQQQHAEISDINDCAKPRIIQILVDNGIFALEDGNFNPGREVTCNEIIEVLSLIP